MRCPPIALALLLVGCPQDPAPLGNTAPSAAISSPAPGTTTWAGDDLTVTGGSAPTSAVMTSGTRRSCPAIRAITTPARPAWWQRVNTAWMPVDA